MKLEEKTKTIFLFILVLTSLVLTFINWYGFSPYEEAQIVFQESFFFEEPKEEMEAIYPSKIGIPLNGAEDNEKQEKIILRPGKSDYQKLWEESKFLLKENIWEETQVYDTEIFESPPFLTVYFNPALPIELGQAPYLNDINEIIKMNYYESGVKIILRDEEDLNYRIEKEKFEGLKNLAEGIRGENRIKHSLLESELTEELADYEFELSNNIYVPTENFTASSHLSLKRERISLDDLLKAVFINKKLARQIAEPDGSLIFTDGEKGLRISNYLEYTAPQSEDGEATHSYSSALNEVIEYICYYGGWPEGLYLDNLTLIGNGNVGQRGDYYYARGRYYHEGFPLVGEAATTEMEFTDKGLYYYKRTMYAPSELAEEELEVAWSKDIIAKALEYYTQKADDELLKVEDVFLAYHITESNEENSTRAKPVWVVEINSRNIYLEIPELKPHMQGDYDGYI